MDIRYYVSLYPLEALIASNLEPKEFGRYMALGESIGSNERIVFVETEGDFGHHFDWARAKKQCVPHEDGRPKHSVWMSTYRVLENLQLDKLKSMYLTTQDGRTLALERTDKSIEPGDREYWAYQELCPVHPLVVSVLDPKGFAEFITDSKHPISVPAIAFANLKTVNLADPENSGNLGGTYDHKAEHLAKCVDAVRQNPDKPAKNVQRSNTAFSYQVIDRAIFVAQKGKLAAWHLPDRKTLESTHRDWARSAMLV